MIRPFALALLLALTASAPANAAIEPQAPVKKPTKPAEPPRQPVLTKAPELLELASADYPPELLARGIGGEAVLSIELDETGQVDGVVVQSATEPAFGVAAMLAATHFVFSPAEVDGKPSPIVIEYRYAFTPEAPVPDAIAGEVAPAARLPVNLAGQVKEAGTRKPLLGAIVELDGAPVAETDSDGRFEVRGVAPGEHELKASSRGHDAYATTADVKPDERFQITLYLLRRSGDPFETVVRTRTERQEVTRVQLDRSEVQKVPGTFGDPLRVIENLPGLARVPGGLGGALLVRGTPPQDTSVYIDGVKIPLLYHFFGLTSVINPEFLDKIDFYPGGFGVRFGRATAGVVEVQSRDVTCDLWHGVAEVAILLSRGYLCAPAGEWSVAAAGRRSYIDLLIPIVQNFQKQSSDPGQGTATVSPIFWDYQVKAERKLGTHDLDVFVFGSDDSLKLFQTGSAENINFDFNLNTAFHRLQFRDRWQLGEHTTLTSSLTPGFERQGFTLGNDSGASATSKFVVDIWSLSWREDFSHRFSDLVTVNAGIDVELGNADIVIAFPVPTNLRIFPGQTFDYTLVLNSNYSATDRSQGYWVEGVLSPVEHLKIVGGLRLDYFDFEHVPHFALQPRTTVRYEVTEGTTLKAAYGLYEKLQEPQFLLKEIGNPDLAPQRAHQFILGVEQRFTDVVDVSLEGFYNLRQELRSPTTAVDYVNGTAKPRIWNNDGVGHTYGLELLVRHLATPDGIFYGWISYTLSRSLQRDHARPEPAVTGENDPGGGFGGNVGTTGPQSAAWYLFPFDQTHILTIVGQWTLPRGWEAGFRFRLTSGNPFTPLDSGVVTFDSDTNRYFVDTSNVKRYSDRLPTFTQLDVRVDKTWTFDLWKFTTYLEVLNAYNAKNVEAYQYSYNYRKRVALTLLPIVPTVGVRGEF